MRSPREIIIEQNETLAREGVLLNSTDGLLGWFRARRT
jgi:hypothetical protein